MFTLAPNLKHSVEFLPIILSILASIIVGISKAGVKGIGVFFVILLAYAYEPKISTGILLPLLIVGDLFAIIYYKKNSLEIHLSTYSVDGYWSAFCHFNRRYY